MSNSTFSARTITLPEAQAVGGKPLQCTLRERRTTRNFRPGPLTLEELSTLLRVACGVNRPGRMRTNPTAGNYREIQTFVFPATGTYRYEAFKHRLVSRAGEYLRRPSGEDTWRGHAPVEFLLVADPGRLHEYASADRRLYATAEAGYVSQNLYLACASMGIATCARGWIKRTRLHRLLKLRPLQ